MTPEELIRAWVQSFNDGDFAAGTALAAPDGTYGITAPSAGTSPAQGEQDARMWKAAFPDARGEITNLITSGDGAACEVTWTGTQTGDLPNVPATHKRAAVRAAVFVTARDGKITRLMHHFDFGGLLTQLGVLPGQ